MNGGTSTCPTEKRQFESRGTAESFAEGLKSKYPDQAPQYPYACEDCPHWHLTAEPPESYALARPRWPETPGDAEEKGRTKHANKEPDIVRLYKEGKTMPQIASITGVPHPSVRYILIKLGHFRPTRMSSTSHIPAWVKKPPSVEVLDEEEARLAAQLESIRKRKELLIEAKRLKIEVSSEFLLIRKEGNTLQLSFAEAADMVKGILDVHPDGASVLDMLVGSWPAVNRDAA